MAWAISVVFPYPGPAITRVSFFWGIVSNTFFSRGLEMASDERGTRVCDIKGSTNQGLQKKIAAIHMQFKNNADQLPTGKKKNEKKSKI